MRVIYPIVTKWLAIILIFLCAVGWKLPGAEEEMSDLHDWANQVQERDIEGSRVENPSRKASEDKWTGLNAFPGDPLPDDLLDMENTVWPPFDDSPWDDDDWDYAEYPDPEDPHTGSWWDIPGGAFRVCPGGGGIVECGECYSWDVGIPSGDIINSVTDISGAGHIEYYNHDEIVFCIDDNAVDGQVFDLCYNAIPVAGAKSYPAYECCSTWIIDCGCKCVGAEPQIYAESLTISDPGNIWLYVGADLDVFPCPPFTWSVSGTGFHFYSDTGPTTAITMELSEKVYLYADNTACGTATVTVTDWCGEQSIAYILSADGLWTDPRSDVYNEYFTCVWGNCEEGLIGNYTCGQVVDGPYKYDLVYRALTGDLHLCGADTYADELLDDDPYNLVADGNCIYGCSAHTPSRFYVSASEYYPRYYLGATTLRIVRATWRCP
jgi:hypothetical protein